MIDALRDTTATLRATASPFLRRVRYGDDRVRVEEADAVGIVVNISEAHVARCRVDGCVITVRPFVGSVTLVPPGCPATFDLAGTAEVLMMQLPWSIVREAAGEEADRVALRPRVADDDPVLARLLFAAAATPGGVDLVAAHLAASRRAERAEPAAPARGGLPPLRLRRVRERIEAALEPGIDDRPLLRELAGEAGLSPWHFAREFRRSTGTSPHRYLIRRRLDRAIALLADRSLAVADIAAAAGFAHASHFARHLRRRTGLSPAAFRANISP